MLYSKLYPICRSGCFRQSIYITWPSRRDTVAYAVRINCFSEITYRMYTQYPSCWSVCGLRKIQLNIRIARGFKMSAACAKVLICS